MSEKFYQIIDHTADTGFEVRAENKKELFTRSAYALTDFMVDLKSIDEKEEINVSLCDSIDMESLFLAWLGEILYLFDTRGFLISKVNKISFRGNEANALFAGEKYDASRHSVKTIFKSATYHNLKVAKEGNEWIARVILDV